MYIAYERGLWSPNYIDPNEPAVDMPPGADTDPRVPVCGQRTWGTDGQEYRCTRAPEHPDNFHQAVFNRYSTHGPAGHVALVWEDDWTGAGGPTPDDPLTTVTLTIAAPKHILDKISDDRFSTTILDLFMENDHDHITIETRR